MQNLLLFKNGTVNHTNIENYFAISNPPQYVPDYGQWERKQHELIHNLFPQERKEVEEPEVINLQNEMNEPHQEVIEQPPINQQPMNWPQPMNQQPMNWPQQMNQQPMNWPQQMNQQPMNWPQQMNQQPINWPQQMIQQRMNWPQQMNQQQLIEQQMNGVSRPKLKPHEWLQQMQNLSEKLNRLRQNSPK